MPYCQDNVPTEAHILVRQVAGALVLDTTVQGFGFLA